MNSVASWPESVVALPEGGRTHLRTGVGGCQFTGLTALDNLRSVRDTRHEGKCQHLQAAFEKKRH